MGSDVSHLAVSVMMGAKFPDSYVSMDEPYVLKGKVNRFSNDGGQSYELRHTFWGER